MRNLRRRGDYCRLDCSYCKPAGFLKAGAGNELAERGEILSCNFPFLEERNLELKAGHMALLHSRLPRDLFLRSALEIRDAGAQIVVLVDQPGAHLHEIELIFERLGLSAKYLVMALKSQDLTAVLSDLPRDRDTNIFFPENSHADFYSVDELPFQIRELGKRFKLNSNLQSENVYLNTLSEADYQAHIQTMGAYPLLRRILVWAYRGGFFLAPLRVVLSLTAALFWICLDSRRFNDAVKDAIRDSYWDYYKVRTQVWGLYIIRPLGDFVVKPFCDFVVRPFGIYVVKPFCDFVVRPFGDYVRKPFGDYVLKPFGDRVLKPFGDFVLKPFSDFVVVPLGMRLPHAIERNSVQGYWRLVEIGRLVRWCGLRPFWKAYYFCRYQWNKRIRRYSVDDRQL